MSPQYPIPPVPILPRTMSFPFQNRFVTVFTINLATTIADKCRASSDLACVAACRPFFKIYLPATTAFRYG